ncbi:bacterioferritin [Nitrospira lenta]|uniref:Bacterioferritin n=1 Tax=Nitrospira lenta TaxID=1436998 RepID=A0A330L0Y3_9BACT|nr:bacterioferritin [Nitrospira lenta]SPP63390.1 Bacterioferritin [Nitrospira lenta]
MKAKEGILDQLGTILTAELTAVHQYLLHAELCRHWGYERLADKFQHLYTEEVTHSSQLVRHMLYLGGQPDVGKLDEVKGSQSVQGLFETNLAFEREDVEMLRKAIVHATAVGDFTTRQKLEEMVVDSEEHVDYFERQLTTIAQVGLTGYLAEQIKS